MNIVKINGRIEYNGKLKDNTKLLRKNMTEAEKKLWFGFFKKIESLYSIRVLKQRPISNFVVDFYIAKYKLVIEVDGDTHYIDGGQEYDKKRTQVLNKLGIEVIRFTNYEVMNNFDAVCEVILSKIGK